MWSHTEVLTALIAPALSCLPCPLMPLCNRTRTCTQLKTSLQHAYVSLVDALYNNSDLDGLGLTAVAKAMLPDVNAIAAQL